MIKRLTIIILILLFLYLKLPSYKPENKNDITNNTISTNTVSSRSLIEPRESVVEKEIATQISQNCINLIKQFEGFREKAYKLDGETNWTIGYGHNGKDVIEEQIITKEQAERLLLADLQGYTELVLNYCEYLELSQNELDALVSFTYNCGFENLKKLTGNQARNKQQIAEKIVNYTKSASESNRNGLQKRRYAEQNLFLGGV